MSHLVFVETRGQANWIKQSMELDEQTKFVALTAEALQALEQCGLPHQTVSTYANTHLFANEFDNIVVDGLTLAQEIETFISQRYAMMNLEGIEFLSEQAYCIQIFMVGVATRALLMRETIRACAPLVVSVFGGDVDPFFAKNGCDRNPMLDIVQSLVGECGFQFQVIQRSSSGSTVPESRAVMDKSLSLLQSAYRYANAKKFGLLNRVARARLRRQITFNTDDVGGLRLLFAGSNSYDWLPILNLLKSTNGVECYSLPWSQTYPVATHGIWSITYSTTMYRLWPQAAYEFPEAAPISSGEEIEAISELFDEWVRQRDKPVTMRVSGCDLLPALAPVLRLVASHSPAIARHADLIAARALEVARPHALCFMALPWMVDKRMAFHCRRQGIPVVCYQHGGSYGTLTYPPHELNSLGHADYFLSYGEGIRARAKPVFPVRARLVPVGSTVHEYARLLPRPLFKSGRKGIINVLWISEAAFRNAFGSTHTTEDTRRYLLQKSCLMILSAASNLRVTYRPAPPGSDELANSGTMQWLENEGLPAVNIASRQPLVELIRGSDIVISDRAASTVWNEAIVQQKPLILHCDLRQTPLMPHFWADLERSCHWCRSREELIAAVRRLAEDGEQFLSELLRIDTTGYLRNYVLHRDDGRCAPRVVSFLNNVCRHGQPVDEWERSVKEGV